VAEAFVLEALRTARTATMVAGWGNVPGVTIKRFCAPGIDAVAQVAARILADDLELVAAGPERMNPNGGTIAMGQMGHAFGATGAILLGCLADELERRGGRYGVAAVSGTADLGVADLGVADLGVADLGVADLGVAVLVERVAS
jgi:acetyl-CoA acetyltransferase